MVDVPGGGAPVAGRSSELLGEERAEGCRRRQRVPSRLGGGGNRGEGDLVDWCVKSRRGWIPREICWSGGGGWLGGWDISLNFRVPSVYIAGGRGFWGV